MGWFWADKPQQQQTHAYTQAPSASSYSACPVDHTKFSTASACPVKPRATDPNNDDDDIEVLNPMNNMPMAISSELAPGQKIKLSTERTISSIPRGENEDEGLWEYPSPQQMLNAMLKKGKGDGIPEDAVDSMVEVHNFLNEGAWQQILAWEDEYTRQTRVEPRLKKFTGKPHDLSPKARMYLWLGNLFPETFNTVPPFDRHDWTVLRSLGKGKGWEEVRYVIDYYGAPDDEETGMPAFMLDTRPALDSFTNAKDRLTHWAVPLWKKAMGEVDVGDF
ncbi:Cytochrome c heme lyase [Candida viswanathii]|uniref:Holocytochrome c-type synthase n=1 Tax=Candida viswanathii TaxID=5486 RepID=A0A367YH77_9ASCO|nr:Cytochrome c heme lyase [Candida viswanathii]